jgi:hypothetical protein
LTMLRNYIAAMPRTEFMARNPDFNFINAHVHGRAYIDAADVTQLRAYFAADNPSSVRLGPLVTRTVTIDVFAEQVWRDRHTQHGNVWQFELASIFNMVRIPFLHTWGIDLVPTIQAIDLQGMYCPNTPLHEVCVINCGPYADCHFRHHKSAGRALHETIMWSQANGNRDLCLSIIGYPICWYFGPGNHGEVAGLAYPGPHEGWIFYGAIASPDKSQGFEEERISARNIIQHELSHNYGVNYQVPCTPNQNCIMSGGFDDEPINFPDVWCQNCKNRFIANLYGR